MSLPTIDQVQSGERIELLRVYQSTLNERPFDPEIHRANIANLTILSELCMDPDMYPISIGAKRHMCECANLLFRILHGMRPDEQWEASKQFYAMIIPLIEDIISVSDLEDLFEMTSI